MPADATRILIQLRETSRTQQVMTDLPDEIGSRPSATSPRPRRDHRKLEGGAHPAGSRSQHRCQPSPAMTAGSALPFSKARPSIETEIALCLATDFAARHALDAMISLRRSPRSAPPSIS